MEKVQFVSLKKQKTLVITDKICLEHAGFSNYANVKERVMQKDNQPENAERLMVLIDPSKGVLTKSSILNRLANFTLVETSTEAAISDVLRIHDLRYIRQV